MRHDLTGWQEAAVRQANRQTDSLAALAVTLFIVVSSLYLVEVLRTQAAVQDCALSGKSFCQNPTR